MANITRPEQLPAGLDVCIDGAGGAGAYLLSKFEALAQRARVRRFADTYKCGEFRGLPVVSLDELVVSFDLGRELLSWGGDRCVVGPAQT
ncbi:MAG: hypothetical protein KKA55_00780 [Proteobacteria bacterium]|nr:hypothetical protein [Pseudomonadota bacterium]MBU1594051.1 hypothetical protein [Pseudomonadota bacterium]